MGSKNKRSRLLDRRTISSSTHRVLLTHSSGDAANLGGEDRMMGALLGRVHDELLPHMPARYLPLLRSFVVKCRDEVKSARKLADHAADLDRIRGLARREERSFTARSCTAGNT